ncbi:MAG: hypothetical protein JNM56_00190 [Planctomycetia bacterium]|nr:hypothetical protein [Planctomycetia bacterium]
MTTRKLLLDRRAKQSVVWFAGLFLLVQLAGSWLLDHPWLPLRFRTATRLLAHLDANHRRPDVVLLGSSRFGIGLHGGTIAEVLAEGHSGDKPFVFNSCVEAGDAISAEFMFDALLERGVRPQLVVMEVSPETVNAWNLWMNYHMRRQMRWEDFPPWLMDLARAHQHTRVLGYRLTPLYVHRCQLWEAVAQRWRSAPSFSRDADREAQTWHEVLDVKMTYPRPRPEGALLVGLDLVRRYLRQYRTDGASAQALTRIADKCRRHGIEVLLVGVPLTSPHRALYRPEVESAFLAFMDCLTREHGCRFVDYRASMPDDFFYDNHHLYPEGCDAFSRKLATETLRDLWRAKHLHAVSAE